MNIEKTSRIATKAFLLVFAFTAVINNNTGCCEWINAGGVPVQPIAAGWMLLSILITSLREFREGPYPLLLSIPEFAMCVIGIIGVTDSLTLYCYGYSDVPSVGTMLGFALFWATHMLLQIARVMYLRGLYFLVILTGLLGFVGYLTDNPFLRFQFDEPGNAMALSSAVFLMLLGLTAYSRERQGP